MTVPVGTHGLSCLNPEDYSAIALWMQCNAEAINASLTDINASFGTYLSRPYIKVTNTSTRNVAYDSGTIGPEGFIGEEQSTSSGSYVNNVLPSTVPSAGYRLPQGVYLMQASIKYTVATPNTNTRRILMVYGQIANTSLSVATQDLTMHQVLEAGGAGNAGAISVQGLLRADGLTVIRMGSFFTHLNTSSVIVVPAGSWNLSLTYLGSGLVI